MDSFRSATQISFDEYLDLRTYNYHPWRLHVYLFLFLFLFTTESLR